MRNIISGEQELMPSTDAYKPADGSLGKILQSPWPSKIQWHSCREVFHYNIGNENKFYFKHKANIEDMARFFDVLEDILLIEDQRTLFMRTSDPSISFIIMGDFWMKQPMRYNLSTCFLRASNQDIGIWHDYEFMNKCAFNYKYLEETRPAVSRFLAGYNWYNYMPATIGWRKHFMGHYKSEHSPECMSISYEEIEMHLIKPEFR